MAAQLNWTKTDAGFEAVAFGVKFTITKSLGGRYTLARDGQKIGKNDSKGVQMEEAERIASALAPETAPEAVATALPVEPKAEPSIEPAAELAAFQPAEGDEGFADYTEPADAPLTARQREVAGLPPELAITMDLLGKDAECGPNAVYSAAVKANGHTLHYAIETCDGEVTGVQRYDGEDLAPGMFTAIRKEFGKLTRFWANAEAAPEPAAPETFDLTDLPEDAEPTEPVPAPDAAAEPKTARAAAGLPEIDLQGQTPDWKALRAAVWGRVTERDGKKYLVAVSALEAHALRAHVTAGLVRTPEAVGDEWHAELLTDGLKKLSEPKAAPKAKTGPKTGEAAAPKAAGGIDWKAFRAAVWATLAERDGVWTVKAGVADYPAFDTGDATPYVVNGLRAPVAAGLMEKPEQIGGQWFARVTPAGLAKFGPK